MIPQGTGEGAQGSEVLPFAATDHHDEDDTHHIVDGDDDYYDDDDDGGLPFALGDSHGLSESFVKANEALGLSLAATTISTRSAASDLSSASGRSTNGGDQTCSSMSPRASGSDGVYYTPRSVQTHVSSPSSSTTSRDHHPMEPSPQCISQTPRRSGRSPPSQFCDEDDDDQPSAAAAAAAEAAAAMIPVTNTAAATAAPGSSFILQSPLEEQNVQCPSLQRRDSPPHDTGCGGSSQEGADMASVLMAPLFPQGTATSSQTGLDISSSSSNDVHLSTSLGFSDLMRKAGGGVGTDDSFTILNAPLRPVLEEAPSHDGSSGKDSDDARTSASTPPMSNLGGGGATIVPPNEGAIDARREGQHPPAASGLTFTFARRRRSPYRTMGPSVQTTQLSQDCFSVSTHLPPPCSVREVLDVLANPDLLRLWCVPVKSSIITSEGGGLSGSTGSGGNDAEREYDGEWVEITTPELLSPSSSCASCLHKGVSATKAMMGFPAHGTVKMFVERNRGQVGLSVGPFMGGMVADHTITVGDNCALASSDHGSTSNSTSSGVVITDTVRVRKDEHADGGGGYSCGLFDALERYVLPGLSGYMTQAALSLENLCDVVCDGEACALAGTCSIDFGCDGGLSDDGNDGCTPLLAQS